MTNALEQLLYPPSSFNDEYKKLVSKSSSLIPFERGMSITLNNSRCSAYDLLASLKEIYQSIYKAVLEKKISRDNLLVSKKLPNRKRVMDMVVNDEPIMVGGIHKYNDLTKSPTRGSLKNFDDFHLHLYVYGLHKYLGKDNGKIKLEKLRSYLQRYLKSKRKRESSAVQIKEVGINSNRFNDVITPSTVYEYLQMPVTNPEKNSWINYLAETKREADYKTPIYYIYQTN